jgi:alpha-amylase
VPLTGAAAAPASPAVSSEASSEASAAVSAAQSSATRSPASSRGALVNLFEWNWPSVARECTSVLGPAGFGGVQVSPPQDSLKRTALGNGSDTVLHPWWEVYQAASYNLTSRMGDEAQFRSMVKTCRAAGVKVYVDTVINHTTGQGGVSYGGKTYSHFEYPGIYTAADFHQKGTDCPSPTGGIDDFNNLAQVRRCELVGLADLRTDSPAVQRTLAAYLNKLLSYGVSGFRVDAAKHIGQPDLIALQKRLNRTVDGEKPYVALEVFGGGPGVLSPFAFQKAGSLLGLDAAMMLKNAFKSYPANATGSLATLKDFGENSGLVPSDKSLTFVQNHDTERGSDTLSYKDGATNTLADKFILAFGYGRPQVYSGFTFTGRDDSPPSDADGFITDTDCAGTQWACVHRDPGILGMVGWHNTVGSAELTRWWDNGGNVIAFSRGNRGWVVLNNDPVAHTYTFATGLAKGTYCDVVHGTRSGRTCSGPVVTVNGSGRASVTVPGKDAVAISVASRT